MTESKLTQVLIVLLAMILCTAIAQAECPNGMCEPGEEGWCPDCPMGPICGNWICEPGEEGWCSDCPMGCDYNGYCDYWEDPYSCSDCQTGACCDEMSGYCTETTQSNCYYMWHGVGSTCASCIPMMGACCQIDGTCMMTPPMGCSGGNWHGSSDCSICPKRGACCETNGMCMETLETECYGGQWAGAETTCDQCGAKWVRQPDGYGVAVWPDTMYAADDFECTTAESIRRIDVWGMWYMDSLPNGDAGDVRFTVRIHANIPAAQSPTGYSMPGEVLWARMYEPGQFTVQQTSAGQYPGWYGPTLDMFEYEAGNTFWKYSFELYNYEFVQQGGGTIYWLSVTAVTLDAGTAVGLVTTAPGQNLYSQAVIGDSNAWAQLQYPSGHYSYAGAPMDMAFAIIGPSNAIGACCDEMTGFCTETIESDCHFRWGGAGTTCASASCVMMPQMGACCHSDGTCTDTDPGGCYDGQWQGSWSSCEMCPPATGACCMPMGECMELTEAECGNMGGIFNGPGSSCLGAGCPRPTGACCDPMGGFCSETTQDNCSFMWQGPGTICGGNCAPMPMPMMGACCLGPGECIQTSSFECSGEWRGEGTDCFECDGPVSPCCLGPGECLELSMRECMARGGLAVATCGQADCPGGSESDPVPPWAGWNCPMPWDCLPPDVFELGGPSGAWYEPNVAYGYAFDMTEPDNALFTKILDFPTGFDERFTIDVNGVVLGAFGPGESVDFVVSQGQGVRSFRLTGVSPLTEPEDGTIFPIKLAFNMSNAQFRMRPLITVDADRNEKVDLADYSKLASGWTNESCSGPDWCGGADIDHDGRVDIVDLAFFAEYWLYY